MIHIALLRGINVSGQKPVKMDRLRGLFEELGCKAVQTYVQSGNVVFEAKTGAGLVARIEQHLAKALGFPVPVILRTSPELGKIAKVNPFLREKGIDLTRLYVTFLDTHPTKDGLGKLAQVVTGADRWKALGSEVYLHCPKGYGGSKLSNTVIEKKLGIRATSRNWNTVNELLQLAVSG
jgi:uncharacterized protein (DUF1697 family)